MDTPFHQNLYYFASIDCKAFLSMIQCCATRRTMRSLCEYLEVGSTHGYPPIVTIKTGPYNSFWFRHFQNIRHLPNFPKSYCTFTMEGNLGSLEPRGQHGEVENRIYSEDYRNLHIILSTNGFRLCREVEGVLCYKLMSVSARENLLNYTKENWGILSWPIAPWKLFALIVYLCYLLHVRLWPRCMLMITYLSQAQVSSFPPHASISLNSLPILRCWLRLSKLVQPSTKISNLKGRWVPSIDSWWDRLEGHTFFLIYF